MNNHLQWFSHNLFSVWNQFCGFVLGLPPAVHSQAYSHTEVNNSNFLLKSPAWVPRRRDRNWGHSVRSMFWQKLEGGKKCGLKNNVRNGPVFTDQNKDLSLCATWWMWNWLVRLSAFILSWLEVWIVRWRNVSGEKTLHHRCVRLQAH